MSDISSTQETLTRIFSLMVRRQKETDMFPPEKYDDVEITANIIPPDVTTDQKIRDIISQNRASYMFGLTARDWLTCPMWLMNIDGALAPQASFAYDLKENGRAVSKKHNVKIDGMEAFKTALRAYHENPIVRWNLIQLDAAQELHKLAKGRNDVHPAVIESFHSNAAEMVEELNRWRPELAIHLR